MQIEAQTVLELNDQKARAESDLSRTTRKLEEGEEQPHVLRERINSLKKLLQGLIPQIESKKEKMKANREAAEKIAEKTFPEIQRLKGQLDEKIKVLTLCHEAWQRNNPVQRIQTSSTKMIKVQKEIVNTRESGYEIRFSQKGPATFSKERKVEQMTIELHRLPQMRAVGWEPLPGQDLMPEPLDGENSMTTGRYPLPEVFEEASASAFPPQGLLTTEVTDEEIEAFEKSLGK
jgi:hypothetical protein